VLAHVPAGLFRLVDERRDRDAGPATADDALHLALGTAVPLTPATRPPLEQAFRRALGKVILERESDVAPAVVPEVGVDMAEGFAGHLLGQPLVVVLVAGSRAATVAAEAVDAALCQRVLAGERLVNLA